MRKAIFNKKLLAKYQDSNGWIPATYFPEDFFEEKEKEKRKEVTVLVSLKNNRVTVVKRMYWQERNVWWYGRKLGYSIVAWQPLPEPFLGMP